MQAPRLCEINLASHVNALRKTFAEAFRDAHLLEVKDKATVRTVLGQDLPLVYFYCHGEQKNIADPAPGSEWEIGRRSRRRSPI